MDREGFEFDLVTKRFIENRWETELGKVVRKKIIEGLKNSVEIRAILDDYVLEHPDNQDPYSHPYYPKDAMKENSFWVLTQDDLRGIRLNNEEFPKNSSFEKKDLNYARFYNCKFNGTNLESTSLTHTVFDKCNLENAIFAGSGGYETRFLNCNLRNVCFWDAGLIDTDFSGSDLSNAYFESAILSNIKVNYLTIFDRKLNSIWETRKMPANQKPELLKSIRIAYGKAELWSLSDQYFHIERSSNRKNIIWNKYKNNKGLATLWEWLSDWIWGIITGYGVKPSRMLLIGLFVSLTFSLIYYIVGNPGTDHGFATSLYYSLTTFATLGYGDLHYTEVQWILRLVSTLEAVTGAIVIAAFVAVMARKVIKH